MKYFNGDYFETLKQIVLQYVLYNYDYCYLDAMHEKIRREETSVIVAGSSHAMNGIIENQVREKMINFSISSQDLYFDWLHIRKALEESKGRIQQCIISIGYYMLYQDLSRSKTMGHQVKRVYYPLFGDSHHYDGDCCYDMLEYVKYDKKIYGKDMLEALCREWSRGFFSEEPSYYGSLKTRAQNNILGLENIIWNELSVEEKERIAIKRAGDHNRLKKHGQSRQENDVLVREMAEYLNEREITPVFVIFPYTQYYNRYIDAEYKEDILRLLQSLPVPVVEFLDMNEYPDMFDDTDFLDTDHLNDKGAQKATALLNEFLCVIK